MSPGAARVTYGVLNLRMGGQVSSLLALRRRVAERGYATAFALPAGVGEPSKEQLAAFGDRPAAARARAMWDVLRALPAAAREVVHLVLPSPAFAALALAVRTPARRLVLQYEGSCAAFDGDGLSALRDDPRLIAPRLLLNNRVWARLAGRYVRAVHLATTPAMARALRDQGFGEVAEVANLAGFDAHDERPLPEGLVRPGERVVAYAGHCHPVKGVGDLVAAFARAAEVRSDLRLLLALSQDGDRRRVERSVAALPPRVGGRVRLAGLVPIAALLRSVDALVLPYRSMLTTTMYPSLLLEADALGCPLVLAAPSELRGALDERSGRLYVVPPGAPEALAAALVALPPRAPVAGSFLALPPEAERVDALCAMYDRLLGGPDDAPR